MRFRQRPPWRAWLTVIAAVALVTPAAVRGADEAPPTLVSGSFESGFEVEGPAEGYLLIQFATDDDFSTESTVCESGWVRTFGHTATIFWGYPGPIGSGETCDLGPGTFYWRAQFGYGIDEPATDWSEAASFAVPYDDEVTAAQDAAEYAQAYDVTLNEALERLELQEMIGELDETLQVEESETYGGLWVENGPAFGFVAQFTEDGSATIAEYVDNTPLEALVEVETAPESLENLVDAAADAYAAAEPVEVPYDSEIDLAAGEVEMLVEDEEEFEEDLEEEEVTLPAEAVIVEAELSEPSAPYIYGGLPFSNSGCTIGFAVKHSSSNSLGVLSAAHCEIPEDVPPEKRYASEDLDFHAELFTQNWDVEWHKTPNHTDAPRVKDGSLDTSTTGYRLVKGVFTAGEHCEGCWVCKYGRTTGKTCGEIKNNHYRPSYVPNANSTFIRVHNPYDVDVVQPGDSGGPWYINNDAVGITSGHFTNGPDGIYMPIHRIFNFSLTILTAP